MQSTCVLLIGLTYSKEEAIHTIFIYILAGICGAPVFSGYKFGIAAFSGSTGGYLIGFPISIYIITYLKNLLKLKGIGMLLISIIGVSIIFLCGVTWLSLGLSLGWHQTINVGLYPFITSETCKIIALVISLKKRRSVIRPLI